MRTSPLPLAAAGLLALLAAGCARIDRSLVLDSDPSGARLYVEGSYVGLTPQRIPYVYPGRVGVRLEKEGYESVAAEVVVKTTADATIGLDFFAENFTPGGIHTVASHRFTLAPLTAVSYTDAQLQEMLQRASALRASANRVEPPAGPGTAAPPAGGAALSPPAPAPAAPTGLPPPVHRPGAGRPAGAPSPGGASPGSSPAAAPRAASPQGSPSPSR